MSGYKTIVLALAFSVPVFLSCQKMTGITEDTIMAHAESTRANAKFINDTDGASPNTFLVKLAGTSDAKTFGELYCDGVKSVKRLFKPTPGKEEMEARFGLDRWFEVSIVEGAVLENVANMIAEKPVVTVVQFNTVASRASDCVSYPYDGTHGVLDTRAAGVSELVFNDPGLMDQWHYINRGNASVATNVYKGADINVRDVWKSLTCGDPDIIVAVVDEGVKYTHPDLAVNMWTNAKELSGIQGADDDGNGYVDDVYGYNFVSDGPVSWGKSNDSGHGTHCAGTIAAVNNNGLGVCGVAGGSASSKGCRIMSCQIFDDNHGGTVSASANAIKYAADMGASVISCSFGYSSAFNSDNAYMNQQGSAEIDAIHYFEAMKGNNTVLDGNIAVFAAGNEAHPYAHYPGAFHDIISVSAFAPDYLPAYYTNYGPGCNISAPGGEYYLSSSIEKSAVLSTLVSENGGDDYGYMQGTSMACPHVSGIVALGLSYAKKLGKTFTKNRFKEMILTSANDLDTRLSSIDSKSYYNNAKPPLKLHPYYHQMGTGSIDAWLLMMQIEGIPCLIAETGRRQWLDISSYFGTASVNLQYLEVQVDEADYKALGLAENPEIKYGRLYIHPTKTGSGKFTITAVGGGDHLGGDDNPPGGMRVTQEISVISRSVRSSNEGWL